jgi:hypothetical protein
LVCRFAAGDEIIGQHLGRDAGDGKGGHGAAHLVVGITQLQSPRENARQSGAGNDAELTGLRHGLGQSPI